MSTFPGFELEIVDPALRRDFESSSPTGYDLASEREVSAPAFYEPRSHLSHGPSYSEGRGEPSEETKKERKLGFFQR